MYEKWYRKLKTKQDKTTRKRTENNEERLKKEENFEAELFQY
jgi:hypothetical protein